MTVHMVRLFLEPPNGNAENAINNWVKNHNEWTADPVSHNLVDDGVGIDASGTKYLRGDYRFNQDSTVTELLDDLENRLSSFQGGLWYRIGYHECTHDENKSTACSWDETRESGTVPSDIPNL